MGLFRSLFRKKEQPAPPPQTLQNAPQQAEELEPIEPPPLQEPPAEKPLEGVTVGISVDGENSKLMLEPSLRARHLYVIGKTRTGKTTLIKNLVLQDMAAGHGVCFVDPHGDAAEDLIGSLPEHRLKDVIYFDPASEYSPAFNLFRLPYQPYKLTEDTISVFKMFFDSWGPRLEHLLRYSILTLLLDKKPRTLKDLRLLLVSPDFRTEIIAGIEDESIREFWEHEFPSMGKDAALPITNKLSTFLLPGSPLLKLFSQPENDLDFTRILNEQKILIVNLAKGKLSEEPSRLLGGLIVTGIQQAALARAELAPEERKEFHLYLDEFQNFVVQSFESILSESAKYKLYLTLAHQTLAQVPRTLESAIFGNVATLIAFQVSAEDAGTLKKEMHRTRYQYRVPTKSEYLPLADLIEQVKKIYKEHDHKSMRYSMERLEEYTTYLNSPDYWRKLVENTEKIHSRKTRRKEVEIAIARSTAHFEQEIELWKKVIARDMKRDDETVQRLSEPDLPPNVLKELTDHATGTPLFADYEFKQTTFPDTDDFINQQPRHAFCRKERAENVTVFRTLPAPDPNPQLKQAILEETKARYQERANRSEEKREIPKLVPVTIAAQTAEELTEEIIIPPAPTLEHDPVQAARERRANPQPTKKRTPSKAPALKNDEDFEF